MRRYGSEQILGRFRPLSSLQSSPRWRRTHAMRLIGREMRHDHHHSGSPRTCRGHSAGALPRPATVAALRTRADRSRNDGATHRIRMASGGDLHEFIATLRRHWRCDRAGVRGRTVPIRLRPTPATSRVLPVTGVELSIGRSSRIARDPEERAEGVERVEPPIEAERELVEVGLQVLGADTVMDAVEPSL